MPMRPCRGDPLRKATATSISDGASRFRIAAKCLVFWSRALLSATEAEAVTSSSKRIAGCLHVFSTARHPA